MKLQATIYVNTVNLKTRNVIIMGEVGMIDVLGAKIIMDLFEKTLRTKNLIETMTNIIVYDNN